MSLNYKTINYIQFIVARANEERYIKNGGAYMAVTHNFKLENSANKSESKDKN